MLISRERAICGRSVFHGRRFLLAHAQTAVIFAASLADVNSMPLRGIRHALPAAASTAPFSWPWSLPARIDRSFVTPRPGAWGGNSVGAGQLQSHGELRSQAQHQRARL